MIPSTEELRELIINYKRKFNLEINLDNPVTIQDKISWLQVYDNSELKTKCTDKIKVREYCYEKLGKDICVPIYKVYDNENDINLDVLPSNVMIKCNHGCYMNLKIINKNINLIEIKQKIKNWLSIDYSTEHYEYQYHYIEKKAFSEKYLGENLTDYKICCFNGIPKIIQLCFNRGEISTNCNYYDNQLNPLYISDIHDPADYNADVIFPKNIELMKEYATKLSKDFKFVRVDFYEVNNKVYLGEMTFTPARGVLKYENDEDKHVSKKIGNMLNLN